MKPRLPQASVLHHERYDAARSAEARQAYDAEMMAFSARHELQAGTWTARVQESPGADHVDAGPREAARHPEDAGLRAALTTVPCRRTPTN